MTDLIPRSRYNVETVVHDMFFIGKYNGFNDLQKYKDFAPNEKSIRGGLFYYFPHLEPRILKYNREMKCSKPRVLVKL